MSYLDIKNNPALAGLFSLAPYDAFDYNRNPDFT